MSAPKNQGALGQALVEFTTSGAFPEEGIADTKLTPDELPAAIQALAQAKSNLEVGNFYTSQSSSLPQLLTILSLPRPKFTPSTPKPPRTSQPGAPTPPHSRTTSSDRANSPALSSAKQTNPSSRGRPPSRPPKKSLSCRPSSPTTRACARRLPRSRRLAVC